MVERLAYFWGLEMAGINLSRYSPAYQETLLGVVVLRSSPRVKATIPVP